MSSCSNSLPLEGGLIAGQCMLVSFLTLHIGENVADRFLQCFDLLLRAVGKFDVVQVTLTILKLLRAGQKQVARFGDHLVSGLVFTIRKEGLK